MTYAFFGHSDAPQSIISMLIMEIKKAIMNGADRFLVGNNGNFDTTVHRALSELKKEYPHIRYNTVLAYMPNGRTPDYFCDTVLPAGIETVPKRFAIDFRNKWMVNECDGVICYIKHSYGGAVKYVNIALRKGKTVINIANDA